MGSNISIGFVYTGIAQEQIKNELNNIFSYLLSHNTRMVKMKVSKDIDGEEWIEYDMLDTHKKDDVISLLAEYYFGQIEVYSNLIGCNNLKLIIRIEKEPDKDYFGFLLDISEAQLLKNNSIDEIKKVTDNIVSFMTDIYGYSGYDYAICDNEAEIEYSPEEYMNIQDDIYSISIIPNRNNESTEFNIIKSSWNIDGLTSRY
ncbi:hypothetical protein A7W90_00130 [Clostridium sp. Bc-iso-3]|nr:hypothetical protein A7W90_00130 [Clostridium sp. Bc-iso-3]